ncbi:MAG: DUF4062 domain-containing protein [Deltaproteobacteria bacterium]|nr:DUF4062 domain-containing protein [Deltaproteobacteria bacterium]
MTDPESENERHHDIFLSSAWYGLNTIRSGLADWLERRGYNAFVFEKFKDEAEWKALLPAAREAICLDHVSRSRLYVGIFRATYGSSARDHTADMAFTDLEFFEAFRSGVPMRLYLLADVKPDARLTALLTLVETVLPGAPVRVTSEANLRDRLERDIDIHFGRRTPLVVPPSRFERYSRALIVHRKADDDRDEGLRFLLDRYPAPELPFDPDLVRAELEQVRILRSYQARMNATWRVFQRLFHFHWREAHDYLDLWDEALGLWATAAAWRGLHGFIVAGRLAADNTLVAVRVLRASAGERASLAELMRKGQTRTGTREEWIRLYGTGGALASEYYSIAKQAPRSLKTHYLTKADSWIAVAERTFAIEPNQKREAGLASIRGHIFLEWGRVAEAIPPSRTKPSSSRGGGARRILRGRGEGRPWLRLLPRRQASRGRAPIVEGLSELERHGSPGFLARAKRKAARAYMRGWAFRKALHELVEVKDLVETYDLNNQGRDVRWMSHLPGFVLDRFRTRRFPRDDIQENSSLRAEQSHAADARKDARR